MPNIITRKRLVAVAAIMALALSGVAYAFWTGGGTGTAGGTVSSGGEVTLTGTVADGSAPGVAVAVHMTAANASSSSITVGDVQLDSITVDAGHAACETGDFSMASVTENHAVPAGATAEALPADGSLAYGETSADQGACKGATLTLNLSVSGS